MIMIMLYFQLCHKPKHLTEILRQSGKPKHSWALSSPKRNFYRETKQSLHAEKQVVSSWVLGQFCTQ